MQPLPTGEPVWDLAFTESGALRAPARNAFVDEVAAQGVTDLFVFSHGWGTSEGTARRLYTAMFPLIADVARETPGVGPVGFAGVFWPSLWFPDTPATVAPRGGSTQADGGPTQVDDAGTAALSGAQIAAALGEGFENPEQQAKLAVLGRIIDDDAPASDAERRARVTQFRDILASLLPALPEGEDELEDTGEIPLLRSHDPARDYQRTAEAFGTAPTGPATQGIGDWFDKARHGAKDALRVFSYTTMKARAGQIGRTGLGPLLAALPARAPGVRVHLIGHSFGARLVSFALAGIAAPASSPVASLLLVQGAFSHWSFAQAQDNPFKQNGELHACADRVHGPLVATFSEFDWAVGRWYPKASFLARQDQSDSGRGGRWDGVGADGFRGVTPLAGRPMPAAGGLDYGLKPGLFASIDARAVINDVQQSAFAGAHSDIRKRPVAQLAVAAAAAHA